VQNPAFTITHDWLNDFIVQYKLDEKYSVKQNATEASYRVEFRGEEKSGQSEQKSNESSQSEQSYVVLPGSGIKIYRKNPKQVKSAMQTVDEVIDTISKNGIPAHLYDKISQYNPSDDPVYKDYLPTSALGSKKILKIEKITKEQVELEMKYANQEISKKFVPGCHNIKYASISQPIKRKPYENKVTSSKKQKLSSKSNLRGVLRKPLNLLERFSIAKVQVDLNKSSWKKPVMHEVTIPELNRKKAIDADNESGVSDNQSIESDKSSVISHTSSIVSKNIKPECTNKEASPRKSSSYLEAAVNSNFYREVVSKSLSEKNFKFSPRKISTCLQTSTNGGLSKISGKSPVIDNTINSTPENKNKRRVSCSEKPKISKKLRLECQNSSIKINSSMPVNGLKHLRTNKNEIKSLNKQSLLKRFETDKTAHQSQKNLKELDSKYQNLKAKIAEYLNSDSEEETSPNKQKDYNLLWSSSDSESESSSVDSNDSGILPLKSVRNYRLKKTLTKFSTKPTHFGKKELKADKVIVVGSSDEECSSDEDVSIVQFPTKFLAQSTPKIPKLKQEVSNRVTAWDISESEISEDSGSFSSNSCESMSVSSTQPQTEDRIELNKLHEILSQSKCLNVHPENSNVPIETSNLSTLQTQEQPNRVNSGLNRTFIFNNKILIETPGCYIYQEEIDKAAEYSQYLEDWLDSVTN